MSTSISQVSHCMMQGWPGRGTLTLSQFLGRGVEQILVNRTGDAVVVTTLNASSQPHFLWAQPAGGCGQGHSHGHREAQLFFPSCCSCQNPGNSAISRSQRGPGSLPPPSSGPSVLGGVAFVWPCLTSPGIGPTEMGRPYVLQLQQDSASSCCWFPALQGTIASCW